MWYAITLPGFSYSFETDRYRDEMEARSHIRREVMHPMADPHEYMSQLKIRPMWERYEVDKTVRQD